MGVCCVVFDIDGMLFEFCMNFLNYFFQYFMFSSRFMLFPTLMLKQNWGVVDIFFFRNEFFLISFHVLCYFQHYIFCFEKCPFTYWLNGRWFLQIVDRDSGNLYPIYPLIKWNVVSPDSRIYIQYIYI